MVAYSFQRRFAEPIRSGAKRQTIRGHRRRPALPGERLQLYSGMRTGRCEKLLDPDPICAGVQPCSIEISWGRIIRIVTGGVLVTDLEAFARSDGFRDLADMGRFWSDTHPLTERWDGVLITWSWPPEAVRDAA